VIAEGDTVKDLPAMSMLLGITIEGSSVPPAVTVVGPPKLGEPFGMPFEELLLVFSPSLIDPRAIRRLSARSYKLAALGWKKRPVGLPSGLCIMIPWLAFEPNSAADLEKYSRASGETGEGGCEL
jgi:hypothetical protein